MHGHPNDPYHLISTFSFYELTRILTVNFAGETAGKRGFSRSLNATRQPN